MGQDQSTSKGQSTNEFGIVTGTYKDNFAYRIVSMEPDSIAQKFGLELALDFILYSPKKRMGQQDLLFSEYLQQNAGRQIVLQVYNMIQQGIRLVPIELPELQQQNDQTEDITKQSQNSQVDMKCLLGIKLRYEQFDEAHLNILAIKDVYLGGPANLSCLTPFKEFILGTPEITFTSLEQFAKYVQINQSNQISMLVYNLDQEQVRIVNLMPKSNWGGHGLLGCDASFGYFNRIPMRTKDQKRMDHKKKMTGLLSKLSTSNDDAEEQEQQQEQDEIVQSNDQVKVQTNQLDDQQVSDEQTTDVNQTNQHVNQVEEAIKDEIQQQEDVLEVNITVEDDEPETQQQQQPQQSVTNQPTNQLDNNKDHQIQDHPQILDKISSNDDDEQNQQEGDQSMTLPDKIVSEVSKVQQIIKQDDTSQIISEQEHKHKPVAENKVNAQGTNNKQQMVDDQINKKPVQIMAPQPKNKNDGQANYALNIQDMGTDCKFVY